MLHGGTVCSLVYLFAGRKVLPNDVIIHRSAAKDKCSRLFCASSVKMYKKPAGRSKKNIPRLSPGDAAEIYFSSSVQSRVSRSSVHFSNWFSLVW